MDFFGILGRTPPQRGSNLTRKMDCRWKVFGWNRVFLNCPKDAIFLTKAQTINVYSHPRFSRFNPRICAFTSERHYKCNLRSAESLDYDVELISKVYKGSKFDFNVGGFGSLAVAICNLRGDLSVLGDDR